MGQVARKAFGQLADHRYQPAYPVSEEAAEARTRRDHDATVRGPGLRHLVEVDLLDAGSTLISAASPDVVATVTADGQIELDDEIYETPSAAARAVSDAATNGWTFWLADTADGERPLEEFRSEYVEAGITE